LLRKPACSIAAAQRAVRGFRWLETNLDVGALAVAAMLLTHPERLSAGDTLMVDCAGDEYSFRGDSTFDRVPLFDYDIAGLEFSILYEVRSRNLWGTPSGFLYKESEAR
jgi:hypothetical protein